MVILCTALILVLFLLLLFKRANKITSPEKYKEDNSQLSIELDENGNIMCPYCSSTQIQVVKRGYHWFLVCLVVIKTKEFAFIV